MENGEFSIGSAFKITDGSMTLDNDNLVVLTLAAEFEFGTVTSSVTTTITSDSITGTIDSFNIKDGLMIDNGELDFTSNSVRLQVQGIKFLYKYELLNYGDTKSLFLY